MLCLQEGGEEEQGGAGYLQWLWSVPPCQVPGPPDPLNEGVEQVPC